MAGSFTTVLIDHYEHLNSSVTSNQTTYFEKNPDTAEAMLGSFQDIPPLVVAILGGFLQQLIGPRKILIASAVPSMFSWIMVAIHPSSFSFLLLSRLSAGLSNGLLTGNVYLSNIASPRFIGSLKMIEVIMILIF